MSKAISVNPRGNWRFYTLTLPAHSTAYGVVTIDGCVSGALVRMDSTGVFVRVNAGCVSSIDSKAAGQALLGDQS